MISQEKHQSNLYQRVRFVDWKWFLCLFSRLHNNWYHRVWFNLVFLGVYPTRMFNDRVCGIVGDAYMRWEQDQLLHSWLLSSLSDSLRTQVIECTHSWQLSNERPTSTFTHGRNLRKFCSELRNTKKGGWCRHSVELGVSSSRKRRKRNSLIKILILFSKPYNRKDFNTNICKDRLLELVQAN